MILRTSVGDPTGPHARLEDGVRTIRAFRREGFDLAAMLPILAEDARMGLPATRLVDLEGGIPLAFQAAVGKWVRAGGSMQ